MTQTHTKGRLTINCLTGFYFLFDVFCVCVYREKHLLIAVPRVVTGEEIGITAPLPLPPSSSFFSSSPSFSHSSLVRPPLLLLLHLPFLLLLLPLPFSPSAPSLAPPPPPAVTVFSLSSGLSPLQQWRGKKTWHRLQSSKQTDGGLAEGERRCGDTRLPLIWG